MEQNLPIIAKKVWSIMRVIYFMLKKGISKTKLFMDLNMMIKRGKIAGKALNNLLFHHHHNWATSTFYDQRQPHHLPFPTPPSLNDEFSDEFSCTTSHQSPLSILSKHKKHQNNDEIINDHAVIKALENMLTSATASPGFGKSPMVRELRITDSPFPLWNGDHEDGQVDEDAEKFIMRFYNTLRRQN